MAIPKCFSLSTLILIFTSLLLQAQPVPREGDAIVLTDERLETLLRQSQFGKHFTPGTEGAVDGLVVDTSDSTDVLALFHFIYQASEGYADRVNFTGDVSMCDAGTVSATFLEDTRRRINYFRAMAGLPANITFDTAKNMAAQEAALITAANQQLSHFPKDDFGLAAPCISDLGHDAAGDSNLAIGSYGAGSVDRYIRDDGANNAVVGHRRWLLYPRAVEMGSGSIPPADGRLAANAIYVIGDFGSRPATPEFVSWPPKG